MTPDERKMCEAFEWAVGQLAAAETLRLADVEAVAMVSAQVRGITAEGRDVEELALQRLAATTEDLLVALVSAGSVPRASETAAAVAGAQAAAVQRVTEVHGQWLSARSELLEVRLSGL